MILGKGKFISYETGEKKGAYDHYGNPSPYFRKEFEVVKKLSSAVLQLSGVGVFKAYINGMEVSGDYLSPGWSDYRTRIPCMSFDITSKLKDTNAIGIIGGDGWAVGKVGNRMLRCNYYQRIEAYAVIILNYEDGSVQYVCTDETWRASSGEIVRNDIYMGEYIDHRLHLGNFSVYGYDDSIWNKVGTSIDKLHLLDKAKVPATTIKHILKPEVIESAPGRIVFDFKQNLTGVISAVLNGQCGAKVVFRHAEMLDKGQLYTENLRRAEAADTYILSGQGDEVFRPLFTFHGFRYAEVVFDDGVQISDVCAQVMYTDLDESGAFSCSDSMVSQLYKNIVWGQRGNFLNVPTDCPQRDERLGWTGDVQIFCKTAMFNMDCKDFFRKYLADVRDAQCGNGGITGVAPIVPAVDGHYYRGRVGAAGWGDVITVLPYEHYRMYGDISIIKENLTACKRYMDFCLNDSKNFIRSGENSYGDWLSVGEETHKDVLATLYFAYSASLTAQMCQIAGDSDADNYNDLAANIRTAFSKLMVDGAGVIKGDTQTSYLIAYAFGIRSASEVAPHIKRVLARSNNKLTTGFLGVKYLLPALCELGMTDTAYTLITSREYPSWGYSVTKGATTMWERWNSYQGNGKFGDAGMNSFNHYALGSCGEWMFSHCLGINPLIKSGMGGFNNILIRPYIPPSSAGISWAKGSYKSIKGHISAGWELRDGFAEYSFSLPQGIKSEHDFSAYKSVKEISAGKYLLKI